MSAPPIPTGTVRVPTTDEFTVAWSAFFATVSAVASWRATHFGPERFGILAEAAGRSLASGSTSAEFVRMVATLREDPNEKVLLGILYEELLFYSWRFRGAIEERGGQLPFDESEAFPNESGDPAAPDAVDQAEIITGSIQPLLDKLPNWLRKAIEAIMEILKLTRGIAD